MDRYKILKTRYLSCATGVGLPFGTTWSICLLPNRPQSEKENHSLTYQTQIRCRTIFHEVLDTLPILRQNP